MATIIDKLEKAQLKRVPSFDAGDRVRVHFQVIEGSRRRTQVFEGVVLKRQGSGVRETFTVRKQSFGVGVERTFPMHSTKIEKIEVAARGEVRRAKLYYLRDRVGKRARVRERAWTPAEQARLDAEMSGAYDDQGPQEEAELVEPTVEEPTEAEPSTETADAPAEDEPAAETAETPTEAEPAAETADAPAEDEPAAETAETPTEVEPAAETTEAPAEAEPAAETEAPAETEATDESAAEADADASNETAG